MFGKFNCPNWWPKDVVFSPMAGTYIVRSALPNSRSKFVA